MNCSRKEVIKTIFVEEDWISAEDISLQQAGERSCNPADLSKWHRQRRIFSVYYHGKEYFAKYQFDAQGRPLPAIRAIIDAFGECSDTWVLAAWFHFPNGWLPSQGSCTSLVAPKHVLDRALEVVDAARKRHGTYIA